MVVFHRMKFSTKDDFREGILKDIDIFGYISLKNPNFGYISGIPLFQFFQISKCVSIHILQPKNSMIVPPIPTVYQRWGWGLGVHLSFFSRCAFWCHRNLGVIWHGFIMWFPLLRPYFLTRGWLILGPEPLLLFYGPQGVARQVPRWVSPNLISVPDSSKSSVWRRLRER